MATRHIYKVIFHNQGKVYEVYARAIHQSALYGFIEIEKILFGEKSSLVLDPSEEHLKSEFRGVSRSYIPVHAVIRIDEVDKQGQGRITEVGGEKVTALPMYLPGGDSRKS